MAPGSCTARLAPFIASIGSKAGVAAATDNAASVISDQGDLVTARKMSEEALALYREVGDQTGIAQTLNNLAAQMVQAGDLSGAEKNFQAALDIWRTMGSHDGIATALTNIGDTRMALGEIAGARAPTRSRWKLSARTARTARRPIRWSGWATFTPPPATSPNAKKSYEESLAISRETGEKHESAVALANLGSLAMQQGDLAAARKNYLEAINLRNEIGEKSGAAEFSLLLASLSIEEEPSIGSRGAGAQSAGRISRRKNL